MNFLKLFTIVAIAVFATTFAFTQSESKTEDSTSTKEEKTEPKKTTYWVTRSTSKIHNSSCRYYGNSNGYSTENPKGVNCKICGGKR